MSAQTSPLIDSVPGVSRTTTSGVACCGPSQPASKTARIHNVQVLRIAVLSECSRVLFPNLFDKPLLAQFDQPHTSSDGGAVLLKAAEKAYGLVAGFVRCLVDRREPGKVRHTVADLLGQRIFGIACGHPDGNDAEHLADNPIHKLLLGRDPVAGDPLGLATDDLSLAGARQATVLLKHWCDRRRHSVVLRLRNAHGRVSEVAPLSKLEEAAE